MPFAVRPRVLAISGSLRARSSNRALLPRRPITSRGQRGSYEACRPAANPDDDEDGCPVPLAHTSACPVHRRGWLGHLSPEYAHGVLGSLKNAPDWLVSCPELPGKPVLPGRPAAGGDFAGGAGGTLRTSLQVLEDSLTAPFLLASSSRAATWNPTPVALDARRRRWSGHPPARGSVDEGDDPPAPARDNVHSGPYFRAPAIVAELPAPAGPRSRADRATARARPGVEAAVSATPSADHRGS